MRCERGSVVVVLSCRLPIISRQPSERVIRIVGLDIHQTFSEVMYLEDGELIHDGRVELACSRFSAFARTPHQDDEVVLEATGNTIMVVRLLGPYVGRVIIANPFQVRAITHAKIKTDKVDAAVLASGFLPEVWRADSELARALGRPESPWPGHRAGDRFRRRRARVLEGAG